jgi:hypothetical protein
LTVSRAWPLGQGLFWSPGRCQSMPVPWQASTCSARRRQRERACTMDYLDLLSVCDES